MGGYRGLSCRLPFNTPSCVGRDGSWCEGAGGGSGGSLPQQGRPRSFFCPRYVASLRRTYRDRFNDDYKGRYQRSKSES